jgi:hypothetical protein
MDYQAHQILTPYEPVVNLCSKWVIKLVCLVFSKELLHAAILLKLPKVISQGAKKEVCFAHRILGFQFFSLFFLCSWFYVTATI